MSVMIMMIVMKKKSWKKMTDANANANADDDFRIILKEVMCIFRCFVYGSKKGWGWGWGWMLCWMLGSIVGVGVYYERVN